MLCLVLCATILVDADDMQVLQNFKKGITNSDVLGWTGTDPCSWNSKMIVCDSSGRVLQLRVRAQSLTGTVTPDINQLTSLTYLELNFNNFTGAMPTLAGLSQLQLAYLDDNDFSSIPSDFFDGLTSIQQLWLNNNVNLNKSTGGWIIPSTLQNSSTLTLFNINNASVTGPIPDFIGTMPALKQFLAAYDHFTGGIPASFGGSNLQTLLLNNQAMNGTIAPVGSMGGLQTLWLQGNQFTGSVPDGLANAAGLTSLRLNSNSFVGRLPLNLGLLPLTEVLLNGNTFDGELPGFKTTNISFDNSTFCGAAGVKCSAKVDSLLDFLQAAGYPQAVAVTWIGPDPCSNWMGVSCNPTTGDIVSIILSDSLLTGTISPSLTNLTSLGTLVLKNNALTGPIPDSLTTLKSLKSIDVSNNNLTGPLPLFASSVTFTHTGNPLLVGAPPAQAPVGGTPPVSAPPGPAPVTPAPVTPAPVSPAPMSPAPVTPIPVTPGAPPSGNSPIVPSPSSTGSPGNVTTPGTLTPANSPSNSTVAGHSKKTSVVGPVVGGVVGAAGLALITAFLVFFCRRKHKKRFLSLQGPSGVLVHPRDSGSEPEVMKLAVNSNNSGTNYTGTTYNGSITVGDSLHSSSISNESQVSCLLQLNVEYLYLMYIPALLMCLSLLYNSWTIQLIAF